MLQGGWATNPKSDQTPFKIFKTANAGRTWKPVQLPLPKPLSRYHNVTHAGPVSRCQNKTRIPVTFGTTLGTSLGIYTNQGGNWSLHMLGSAKDRGSAVWGVPACGPVWRFQKDTLSYLKRSGNKWASVPFRPNGTVAKLFPFSSGALTVEEVDKERVSAIVTTENYGRNWNVIKMPA